MEYDESAGAGRTGPRRHRWPAVLAATAAAALLVASAATVVHAVRHHSGTSAPVTLAFTSADLGTGDPSFRLGPDQVPSIAGLDAQQATALLKSHGYRVVVSKHNGCSPAASDLTLEPETGTIAGPGTVVTLHESVPPPGADCAGADHPDPRVLAFLAWARGLGRSRGSPPLSVSSSRATARSPGTTTHCAAALPPTGPVGLGWSRWPTPSPHRCAERRASSRSPPRPTAPPAPRGPEGPALRSPPYTSAVRRTRPT